MLACARIGAVHSVVFGGFSAESLRDRINDAQAKVLITADGGYRRGQMVPFKRNVDEALSRVAQRASTCVVLRAGPSRAVPMQPGRDHLVARPDGATPPTTARPSRWTPRTRCSSSTRQGTTGKPKGILHTTGGYLTQVVTRPPSGSSTSRRRTSSGARPTSAG